MPQLKHSFALIERSRGCRIDPTDQPLTLPSFPTMNYDRLWEIALIVAGVIFVAVLVWQFFL